MASAYYLDENSRFIPEPSGYYGTYTAREPSVYRQNSKTMDLYARPQMALRTTTSFVGTETSDKSTCISFVDAIIRPCVAEFLSVFIAVFIFNHLESELSERHVTPIHKIIILALSDAVSAAIFLSAFRTVHLNPVITLAHLFSLTSSWYLCVLLVTLQFVAGTTAVAANSMLRDLSPTPPTIHHDMTTDWTKAAYRLVLSQLLGTLLVVSANLLCVSARQIGHIRVGHLSQSPLCLFLSVLLASFLSLLQSSLNWNPLQASSLSIYRALSKSPSDAFSVHYVYWFGPVLGSLLACALFRLLFAPSDRRVFSLNGCRAQSVEA